MQPEMIVHKCMYWGRRSGSISNGAKGMAVGTRFIRAYQKAAGRTSNGGPSGRRRTRWYQGRYRSGYRKEG